MKKLLLILRSYFPTKLPVGITEFNQWVGTIIELSGPMADELSMRFAVASILIHADAKHGSLPNQYFVTRLRKSAANQVASQVFQEIKQAQAEAAAKAIEEAKNNQPTEATADNQVAANGTKVS